MIIIVSFPTKFFVNNSLTGYFCYQIFVKNVFTFHLQICYKRLPSFFRMVKIFADPKTPLT